MTSAAQATVDRLLGRVREPLLELERRYRAQGRSVADAGLDELALRMASVVPAPSPVNERLGPFYRTEQVVRLMGISRQAVADRVRKGTLLGMQTADGSWVYPMFQFKGRRLLVGFSDVLRHFNHRDIDRWAVAAWWVSPSSALGGSRPLDWIRSARDDQALTTLARDTVRRWTE